jgi:hypothetical protein
MKSFESMITNYKIFPSYEFNFDTDKWFVSYLQVKINSTTAESGGLESLEYNPTDGKLSSSQIFLLTKEFRTDI